MNHSQLSFPGKSIVNVNLPNRFSIQHEEISSGSYQVKMGQGNSCADGEMSSRGATSGCYGKYLN